MTRAGPLDYLFYPGCSLERNAYAYLQSTRAIAPILGLDLQELEDWNCCGATEYISLDLVPAYALVGRNLALAEQLKAQSGRGDLVAPCSACYMNLNKTDHYMAKSAELEQQVNAALGAGGLHYTPDAVQVRHLLDIVVNDVGYDTVAAKVTRPLLGLKIAPYYGCLILRPEYNAFDDPEYPTCLDKLLRALGAEVVDYPLKGECCGGHMTQISAPTAMEMIHYLIKTAADAGADAIATVCPMCQLNLDAFQGDMNRHFGSHYAMPVLYFTQLMGLAFGLSRGALGIGKELVNARAALDKIQVAPGAEVPAADGTPPPDLAPTESEAGDIPGALLDAGRWTATAGFWSMVAGFWKLVGRTARVQSEEGAVNKEEHYD